MRPGNIHGSGREAGPGAERPYRSLRQADARVRRAAPAAVTGAADANCSDRCTRRGPAAVPFASDQHPVQALAAGTAHPAFRDPIRARRLDKRLDDPHPGRGEYGVERHGELGVPIPDQELHASACSPRCISRLRTCWATHSPVGCAVIPAGCTRRVPCSMKSSTYRRRKNTVSTWKKSVARIVFAWASRNVRQVSPDRVGARGDAGVLEDLPHRRRGQACIPGRPARRGCGDTRSQVSRHEPCRPCPATARLVPLAIGAAARGPERECHR